MEESTSTIDPQDIISGTAVTKLQPFTHEQWALRIFEGIRLIKSHLGLVHQFGLLGGTPQHLELFSRLHGAGVLDEFGTNNRVALLREFYVDGLYRSIFVFLTQKGKLRVISVRDEGSYVGGFSPSTFDEQRRPEVEVWAIKDEVELAAFLKEIEQRYPTMSPRRYSHEFGNTGFWILYGILKLVGEHEYFQAERVKPFTEYGDTLEEWLNNLKVNHGIKVPVSRT